LKLSQATPSSLSQALSALSRSIAAASYSRFQSTAAGLASTTRSSSTWRAGPRRRISREPIASNAAARAVSDLSSHHSDAPPIGRTPEVRSRM
jgi:hypothetical protein